MFWLLDSDDDDPASPEDPYLGTSPLQFSGFCGFFPDIGEPIPRFSMYIKVVVTSNSWV